MGLDMGSKTFNMGIEGEKIEFISKWLSFYGITWHAILEVFPMSF